MMPEKNATARYQKKENKMEEIKKGKQIGLIRNIDNLGRIVIPKEYRKSLNIECGDSLEIFLHENGIFITESGKVKEV